MQEGVPGTGNGLLAQCQAAPLNGSATVAVIDSTDDTIACSTLEAVCWAEMSVRSLLE